MISDHFIYLFIYIQVLDGCRKVEDEEIKNRNGEEIQFPQTDIDLSDLENPGITQVNHVSFNSRDFSLSLFVCMFVCILLNV